LTIDMKPQPEPSTQEVLAGLIERVTYHNAEIGFCVLRAKAENPYRLARDIRGVGFKTADAIAMKLGIEKTAMIRVLAGISYALTDARATR
jgi:ATP-dependent exoDNAse (exonuclease V) alpha subunit